MFIHGDKGIEKCITEQKLSGENADFRMFLSTIQPNSLIYTVIRLMGTLWEYTDDTEHTESRFNLPMIGIFLKRRVILRHLRAPRVPCTEKHPSG